MDKLLLILCVSFFTLSSQASWRMRSAYKPVPNAEVERSVLYFTSGDRTKTYAPLTPPFGLISSKKYLTAKGEFYLTGWAQGAQSVVFRVFDMSKTQAKPICEIVSYGEISRLKLKDQTLYLEKIDSLDQVKAQWEACAQIESRK